jgi:hypothetical protein
MPNRTLSKGERIFLWVGGGIVGLSVLAMIMGVIDVSREQRY